MGRFIYTIDTLLEFLVGFILLTIQTIVGASKMLEESGKSPTTLRENVTSPNGTTAAALAKFSEGNLGNLIATSMKAARDRSQELA